jgi:hypothetical protein
MIHNARFRYNGILFSLFRDLESKDQICTTCDQYERTLAKLKKENQELQDRYYILQPHPLPEVNLLMVEIRTLKPYIFMIRVTRQIKCLIAQALGVIPHPLPQVNFIMVEIPTPKPYIFMITVNRQIKCPKSSGPGSSPSPTGSYFENYTSLKPFCQF